MQKSQLLVTFSKLGNKSQTKPKNKKKIICKLSKSNRINSVAKRSLRGSSITSLSGSNSSFGELVNLHKTMEDIPLRLIPIKHRKPKILKLSNLFKISKSNKLAKKVSKKDPNINLTQIEEYSSNMVKQQIDYVKRRNKRTGSFLTDKQFKEVRIKLAALKQTKQKIIDSKR
jgi:hypothetical protein